MSIEDLRDLVFDGTIQSVFCFSCLLAASHQIDDRIFPVDVQTAEEAFFLQLFKDRFVFENDGFL